MEENACLICSVNDVPLRSLSGYSNDKRVCNNQLQVILLLRKVLRLRKSFVETLLRKSGENPASWDLKLCSICHRVFEEASFVSLRLKKLNFEFEELAESLRSKVVPNEEFENSADFGGGRKRKVGRLSKNNRSRNEQDDRHQIREQGTNHWIHHEIRVSALRGIQTDEDRISRNRLSRDKEFTSEERKRSEANSTVNHDFCESVGGPPDFSADEDDGLFSEMGSVAEFDDFDYLVGDPLEEQDDGGNANDELDQLLDNDSDYEPPSKRRRSRIQPKCRDHVSPKAIKVENGSSYECSICQSAFENFSLCNEHISATHSSNDSTFHTTPTPMNLPIVLPDPSSVNYTSELVYKVVPLGSNSRSDDTSKEPLSTEQSTEVKSKRGKHLYDKAPPNVFTVPVLNQVQGNIKYVVMSNKFQQMSPEILKLLTRGNEDKMCCQCLKSFPTELQLQGHIKYTHEGVTHAYSCLFCPRKSDRFVKLLDHMDQAHVIKHCCYQCGKNFFEDILLQAHIRKVHMGIEEPYKCCVPDCGERFEGRNYLNKHLKRAHKLQLECSHPMKHDLLGRPQRHPPRNKGKSVGNVRKAKKVKPTIPCPLCKEANINLLFATEEELDVHTKRKHLGIKRPFPCTICKKKFSSPKKLEAHMSTHHTVRSDVEVSMEEPTPPTSFDCLECNKTFKSKSIFNQHLRGTAHNNISPFVCEMCSQAFKSMKSMTDHQTQKHYKELKIDPFKCNICGRVLVSKRHLRNHMRVVHFKSARFKCPHCDICFEYENALKNHVNIRHTKKNIVMCPYCPRTFLNNFNLKCHYKRVHSGEQPYQCKECFKKFSDKPTYNRHVEAHMNIIHDCPHCSKTGFKTRHALRVHVRSAHAEKLVKKENSQIKIPSTSEGLDEAVQSCTSSEAQIETNQ